MCVPLRRPQIWYPPAVGLIVTSLPWTGCTCQGMSGEAGTDTLTVRLAFGSLTSGPIRINYMAM